jgi:hypothetical protein
MSTLQTAPKGGFLFYARMAVLMAVPQTFFELAGNCVGTIPKRCAALCDLFA